MRITLYFLHFKSNKIRPIDIIQFYNLLEEDKLWNESILVNKGLDIVSVAKRLGHLPSTATNYYLDQIPKEDKMASKILDNLF